MLVDPRESRSETGKKDANEHKLNHLFRRYIEPRVVGLHRLDTN